MDFANFLKNFFFQQCEGATEQENASFSNQTSEARDYLIPSAIKDADQNRSEASIVKQPIESTMSASMSGIGVLEDSNESEMAETLIVSDNEGKLFLFF